MGGNQYLNARGLYGPKGVPFVGAFPGGRGYAAVWNMNSSLWVFGGRGIDAVGGTCECRFDSLLIESLLE